MEKKLSDYLHLYLGCEVEMATRRMSTDGLVDDTRKGTFQGYWDNNRRDARIQFRTGPDGHIDCLFIKPILRPLASMTEEDVSSWGDVTVTHTPYCVELDSKDDFGEFTEVYPDGSILSKSKDDGDIRPINGGELFRLLLSKGFDLFNLIPEGLAIDATQQPITP